MKKRQDGRPVVSAWP